MKITIDLAYFVQPLADYLQFLFPAIVGLGKASMAIADAVAGGGYVEAMIDFDNL